MRILSFNQQLKKGHSLSMQQKNKLNVMRTLYVRINNKETMSK